MTSAVAERETGSWRSQSYDEPLTLVDTGPNSGKSLDELDVAEDVVDTRGVERARAPDHPVHLVVALEQVAAVVAHRHSIGDHLHDLAREQALDSGDRTNTHARRLDAGRRVRVEQVVIDSPTPGIRAEIRLGSAGGGPFARVSAARRLAAALHRTDARLHVFPDLGHGLFREDPDASCAVLRDFLGSPAPGNPVDADA